MTWFIYDSLECDYDRMQCSTVPSYACYTTSAVEAALCHTQDDLEKYAVTLLYNTSWCSQLYHETTSIRAHTHRADMQLIVKPLAYMLRLSNYRLAGQLCCLAQQIWGTFPSFLSLWHLSSSSRSTTVHLNLVRLPAFPSILQVKPKFQSRAGNRLYSCEQKKNIKPLTGDKNASSLTMGFKKLEI